MATLRELLAEQERCKNRLGNTVAHPDEQEKYLRIQKEINAMADVVPPGPPGPP